MRELLIMVGVFMAGAAVGVFYFFGLWLTVKKAITAKIPALWISGSYMIRTGITLAGFYYTSQGNWQRMIICLCGFLFGRYLVSRYTNSTGAYKLIIKKEAGYES
jgi:F1F0 ATPase subunit 2